MDGRHFDDLTRHVVGAITRRGLVHGLLAASLGLGRTRGAARGACGRDGEPCGCCRNG